MEASSLEQYNLDHHRYLRRCVQFVPYSFKENHDLDQLKISALTRLNLVNYVTSIQRLCVAEDVFWWSLFNTDADGERLLIRGQNGSSCVINWHEIQVAFGANHDQREEFRPIKIAHKQFAAFRLGDYLPETVETNANKKLVSGQPYEEINYYKEAAPYGPTYYLMTIISELFWCNVRSPRFTSAQVFRKTIFAGSSLATADGWLAWSHMSREGDIDYRGLLTKFPVLIDDLREIREKYKMSDDIPIATPVQDGSGDLPTPSSSKRKRQVQDVNIGNRAKQPKPAPIASPSRPPKMAVCTRFTTNPNAPPTKPSAPTPSAPTPSAPSPSPPTPTGPLSL
ncbi:hypothetical protein R1sor_010614 [Riccia sorocarpa]|uniref:Fungal-type protein kinase domain-containing protein n=1 Tax=Riccia sorocarpa TaxID=122646 RepID=A0ABD3HYK9_9MARC